MPVINIDSLGGRVLGENAGGVQKDYVVDALGSVTGYRDGAGSVINRYEYKPFGMVLSRSGIGADPSFMFCGTWGYLATNRTSATSSVRFRFLDAITGAWSTVDPLWPLRSPYNYVGDNPTTRLDFYGLSGVTSCFSMKDYVWASIPPVVLKGGFEFCASCYECKCPKHPGDWASECITGSASAQLEVELPIGEILDILKEVVGIGKVIISALDAILGMIACGAQPNEECKEKTWSVTIEFCLGACLVFDSAQCCSSVELPSGSHSFECKNKVGYCGLPKLYASLGIGVDKCW